MLPGWSEVYSHAIGWIRWAVWTPMLHWFLKICIDSCSTRMMCCSSRPCHRTQISLRNIFETSDNLTIYLRVKKVKIGRVYTRVWKYAPVMWLFLFFTEIMCIRCCQLILSPTNRTSQNLSNIYNRKCGYRNQRCMMISNFTRPVYPKMLFP